MPIATYTRKDGKVSTMEVEAQVFRVMGHPFRLQILEALRGGEACVCHLSSLLERPQPYVSKQLAELRDAGLVVDRREGFRIYYRLADPVIGSIIDVGRAALLNLGVLRPEEKPFTRTKGGRVPGCDCPQCTVA